MIITRRSRIAALGGAVIAVALGVSMFMTTAAQATGLGGTMTPYNSTGATALSGPQAGTTAFTQNLGTPPANTCSANSSTGGTNWYSYLAPQYTDPGTENATTGTISIGTGLWAANPVLTGPDGGNHTTAADGTVPKTVYQFSRTSANMPGGIIPSGSSSAVYEVGTFCWNTNTNAVTDWWNAECTFNGSSASFTWSCVPGPPSPNPQAPEVPMAILLPIGGGLVLGGGLFFRNRRRKGGTPNPLAA